DVGTAVAVDIGAGDVNADGDLGVIGHEIHDQRAGDTIEDANLGSAGRARSSDDVWHAVAVDVAGGDTDAAGETWVVGEEFVGHAAKQAIEDTDERPAAGVGPGDDRLGQHRFADGVCR